jgi:hypothetical protein
MEEKMRARHVLIAATLLAGTAGAAVLAQQTATYDPTQLPAIRGKVTEYSLTPRGDVDGLILEDGTEVHLPPHLGVQLVFTVKPGDQVTVHGLKARSIAMVQAISVTNDATGSTVTDNGPNGARGPREPGQPLSAQGRIKAQLHGPQGDLNGVLLEDGTIVRLPPPEALRFAAELVPGQMLYVDGEGIVGPLGKVIAARLMGPSQAQLAEIQAPPPRGPGHRRREPNPLPPAAAPPAPVPPAPGRAQ